MEIDPQTYTVGAEFGMALVVQQQQRFAVYPAPGAHWSTVALRAALRACFGRPGAVLMQEAVVLAVAYDSKLGSYACVSTIA